MNYFWHLLVMISVYAILAGSLNIVVGYTGMLSVCHAAFYGLGAYGATLLMVNFDCGFFVSLAIATVATTLLSVGVCVPTLRLRGDHFVLGTLGFQIIVFSTLYNWVSVTRGPFGFAGIPTPSVFGAEVNTPFRYFLLSGAFALVGSILMWCIVSSPFGRVLRAIREDELAAISLGKNVAAYKTVSFALAAAFAAVSGGLFAGYVRYIDPTSFDLMESVLILSIVIIGGAGSFRGPLFGAVLLVLLPELLRFLQIDATVAANLRQVIFGILIIALMRFRPRGFFGEYEFE